MMRFAHPEVFWLLLLVPFLLLLIRLRVRRTARFVRRLGDPTLLRQTPSRFPVICQEWVRGVLVMMPVLCTILALADPRVPHGEFHLRAGTLDVVMVIDVSKSMAAEDESTQSRLAKAREIVRTLLPALRGNRVGLVTFAGSSFRQAELTEDVAALEFILTHWVTIGSAGVGGSNLARALETGLAMFPEDPNREELLLLFSDGGEHTAHLQTVLTNAAHRGVRIVTLGLGNVQPSPIPVYDDGHRFSGFVQVEGQVVTTQLNEAPLQQIAMATKGTYQRVAHRASWRHLLTQHAVVGDTLTRDERKMFQAFLLTGLLGFGTQALLARL
jgi:Ca-activated chloride channel family protein